MDFDINSFDLLMTAVGVMTYAIGAAIWTCCKVPPSSWAARATNQAATGPFKLENSNEFL